MSILGRFLAAEDGATAIELGLFGALISMVAMTALGAMDDGIAPVFEAPTSTIKTVLASREA